MALYQWRLELEETNGTAAFLGELYGELPDGAWWTVWTLPDKHSEWVASPTDAAAWVEANQQNRDVYCSVAFAQQRGAATSRISYDLAAGVVGLYADMDIGKPGYPADETEAGRIIARLPEYSLRVHSGHGLQLWWLFKEPLEFDSDATKQDAAKLLADWKATVLEHAKREGLQLDSGLGDIARVLRVPGTTNRKGAPVPVVLQEVTGVRYTPDQLSDHLVGYATRTERSAPVPFDLVTSFPLVKHEALLDNSPQYAASWRHERKDLGPSPSMSQWDQSLCSIAAMAGWTPSELAALIRQHREKWGDPRSKSDRIDYIDATIRTAYSGVSEAEQLESAQETLQHADESTREATIAALATKLGIDLANVQLVTGKVPSFRFTLNGNVVAVRQADVLNQETFRRAMYELAGKPSRRVGAKEVPGWDALCEILANVAEVVETGDETTLDGEIRVLIEGYTEKHPVVDCPTGQAIERPSHPFLRDGRLWFRADDLLRYAQTLGGMRIERGAFLQRLRGIGAEPHVHAVQLPSRGGESRRTTMRFWGVEQ